jgi:hypothetical protein
LPLSEEKISTTENAEFVERILKNSAFPAHFAMKFQKASANLRGKK